MYRGSYVHVIYAVYDAIMIYIHAMIQHKQKSANEKKNCQNFVLGHRYTPFSSKSSRGGSFERRSLQEERILKTNKNLISKISAVFPHMPLF